MQTLRLVRFASFSTTTPALSRYPTFRNLAQALVDASPAPYLPVSSRKPDWSDKDDTTLDPSYEYQQQSIHDTHFIPGKFIDIFREEERRRRKNPRQPPEATFKIAKPHALDKRNTVADRPISKREARLAFQIHEALNEIIFTSSLSNAIYSQHWEISIVIPSPNQKSYLVHYRPLSSLPFPQQDLHALLKEHELPIRKIVMHQLGKSSTARFPKLEFRRDRQLDVEGILNQIQDEMIQEETEQTPPEKHHR